MNDAAKLTRGSIRSHLVSQTLPMIVGVAAIMSIGLVDAYYVGQLGSAPLAAISFIFPIGVALSSLGVGVMVGINSVVARALGSGDVERAHRRASFGILFALAIGAAIGAALFLLHEPLFRLMQADSELMPLIGAYVRPFALGFPLQLLILGINGVLRGQGEARKTSLVSVSYAAANWVLNPVLITGAFGFEGFGMAGAAYATVIGWLIGVVVAMVLLSRTALPFAPRRAARTHTRDSAIAILKVAGPAAFSNAINPIGLSVLTALAATEGQATVAAFGAAGRLQSFAVVPLLGLSGSIGAIVGQNWGAGLESRARLAVIDAGLFCLVYGFAMAAILVTAGGSLAHLFSEDPQVVAQFTSYLAIAAWGYAGYGLLIVGNGALNALDKAGFALMQSCARVFLVMLPFAWLMRGALGADAIFAAELAANLAGGTLAAIIVWRILRPGRNAGRPPADLPERI